MKQYKCKDPKVWVFRKSMVGEKQINPSWVITDMENSIYRYCGDTLSYEWGQEFRHNTRLQNTFKVSFNALNDRQKLLYEQSKTGEYVCP